MSEDIQTYPRFAYKSFGDILSDGFVLFARNWLKIIVPFAFFSIIAIIIKNFLLLDLIWSYNLLYPQLEAIYEKILEDPNSLTNADMQIVFQYFALFLGSIILESVIGAFFTVLAICSVSSYLLKRYKDIDTSFFKDFKSSFNSRLFIVLVLIGMAVPLGSVVLVPGLILFKLYIFSVFTYRNESEKQSLKEARTIAKGQFWKIIGIFFIPALIIFIINLFIYHPLLAIIFPANQSWYNPITRNYGMIILYDLIVNQFFTILLGPLFICFLTTFYTSLKAKKSMLFQFEREPMRITSPSLESLESEITKFKSPYETAEQKFESGLYCPFCGKFMEKKFERCPFCNESLDFEF